MRKYNHAITGRLGGEMGGGGRIVQMSKGRRLRRRGRRERGEAEVTGGKAGGIDGGRGKLSGTKSPHYSCRSSSSMIGIQPVTQTTKGPRRSSVMQHIPAIPAVGLVGASGVRAPPDNDNE